ncbi:MAG: cupin domain-containing protein [Bryobacteraceae bacterium]
MRNRWLLGTALIACLAGAGGYSMAQTGAPKEGKLTTGSLFHFNQIKEEPYGFGWIRWLMSGKLDGQAEQTFGIVEIAAHRKNALHMHPNCEELLYVLSGSCEHIIGDSKVVLHAGDLLRVPRGVKHQAIVLGDEPLRAVISYSSPDRQVVNLAESHQ